MNTTGRDHRQGKAGVPGKCARVALVCLALLAIASGTRADEGLIEALRAGGHTLYFRHAATDWSQYDQVNGPQDWASCDGTRVRQLSAAGRAAAAATGAALRKLAIPIGKVLASPYCRTVETAALLTGGEVETSTDILNLRAAEFVGGREAVIATARALFAVAPAVGTNTLLVAHGNVALAVFGVRPGEGEAMVLRPDGAGGFEVLGRITPEAFAEAAR